ncbi:MAG: SPASM domain-containing protein [Mycobacteriales bacterium]
MQEYIAKRDHDLVFQVEGCQLYTAYPDLPDPVESEYERLTMGCEAGNGRAEVMHDGTLLPCALLNKHRWGDVNVFENGLQHAWDNGQALARIRSYKNTDPTCNSCSYRGFCNGGCPAMNEKTYGSITDEGDSRCEIRTSNLPASPARMSFPLTVVG